MTRCLILLNDATQTSALSATGTVAGLGVANLKTDPKGEICRFSGTSGTITATWTSPVQVGSVVIPACNFSASSTIRVRVYSDSAGATLVEDTGVMLAAPGTILGNWGFDLPLNVNHFVEGSSLVQVHLQQQRLVQRVVIDFTNPGNTVTDISRLLIGAPMEFKVTADFGASAGVVDSSLNSRAASGDMKTDWGPRNRKLTFEMSWLPEGDRERASRIMQQGIGKWIFVSLTPEEVDPIKKADYSIYGKLTQPLALQYSSYRTNATSFDIEGY